MKAKLGIIGVVLIVLGLVLIASQVYSTKHGSAAGPVPVSAVYTPVEAPAASLKYDKVSVKTEASKVPVLTDPSKWIYDVAYAHGITPNVPMTVAYCQAATALGCTGILNGTPVYIKITPGVIGTEQGVHIVLHELGHASGIFDECQADAFAVAHGSSPNYPDAHCR